MNIASAVQLIVLAAIWGASFLFMRIAAPIVGSAYVTETRVLFAALFLLLVALYLRKPLELRKHARHYFILGLFNSALPFLLFAYAAQTLGASMLSILNATAPIWGALLVALWHRQGLSLRMSLGLLLGVVGVSVLVGFDPLSFQAGAAWAIAAALTAALCYGIASLYARNAPQVESFNNAHGSMWAATLIILPVLPFFPMHAEPDLDIWLVLLTLGVLCSGIAYLLYFRLIADVGTTSALTVTFLVPVFGILWGRLFLGEVLGWQTLLGACLVVCGTALVTGFNPRQLWAR